LGRQFAKPRAGRPGWVDTDPGVVPSLPEPCGLARGGNALKSYTTRIWRKEKGNSAVAAPQTGLRTGFSCGSCANETSPAQSPRNAADDGRDWNDKRRPFLSVRRTVDVSPCQG